MLKRTKPSIMRKIIKTTIISGLLLFMAGSCAKESKLDISLSSKFEGQTVELMNYADSTVIASTTVTDGKASFVNPLDSDIPIFTQLVIDGRVRAYYVLEPGNAFITDSMTVASGTPLNEEFARLITKLDSIENLDILSKYVDFAEECYNNNKDNVLGQYFGVEWLKYADPQKVDSMLRTAPQDFRESRRTKYYENFAKLRSATAPGMKYTDFAGEDKNGQTLHFRNFIESGKYTIVDFWASWCPYCIKELPEMKDLYAEYHDKGLNILGVAVRDKTSDTLGAVDKFDISWPQIFNTQKTPYDIYGFSGIPHHILIGPDGVIISRGESVAQLKERLEELIK